jgi:predicted DNA-binding transcriptional regulator AlpA
MMANIKATPAESRQLILTREAAKVIGCSMSNIRWLAKTGRLKSLSLGPRSLAFDLEECKKYRATQTAIRAAAKREGKRARGKEPQGFSPDIYRGGK